MPFPLPKQYNQDPKKSTVQLRSKVMFERVLHTSMHPARISDEAKRAWSLIKFSVWPCCVVLR